MARCELVCKGRLQNRSGVLGVSQRLAGKGKVITKREGEVKQNNHRRFEEKEPIFWLNTFGGVVGD